ncbi:virulence factor family protein [Pistricoccus aurantiacus]|uniref:Virulence factor family protein n=1 Tax=Pistricoccus aurantiacus TaxID=1883414 RepID=A0A5B8SVH3_9GAMM|nr:AcvB/VirJ family lysyl-phosphatidylglycerol hydrolase [Pistricoccus aurantiacus]QEA39505.1 virulence factor family protein [Pistricoccus aurantiacus]
MNKTRFLVAALSLLVLVTACQPQETTIAAGRMGEVVYLAPEDEPSNVIFLFSDTTGWNVDLDEVAEGWRRKGAAVLKVPLPRYLDALRESDDGCHYLISEIEDTSHRLQAELGTERYHAPILAGAGMGATLVYAALAQSPAVTIAGAASDGAPGRLDTRVPLCAGAASIPAAAGGFTYTPEAHLNGWWRLLPSADQRESAREFIGGMAGAQLVAASGNESLVARLDRLLQKALTASSGTRSPIESLPLHELPVDNQGDLMAVIWSGDGGWRDLDKTIGERLQSEGIPVVGVDSLRYFWRKKTPEQVARDLAAILEHYQKAWGRSRVILAGYSFGADVMPFAVDRLPEDLRTHIARISLLGMARDAAFGIHVVDRLLGRESKDALSTLPEVAKLDLRLVQCVYGEEEENTACTAPEFDSAERIKTNGGHHFDGNYDALAQRILRDVR